MAERPPFEKTVLCQMLGAIRHRGPDDFGLYRDRWVSLGNARLSIIDLTTGQQPIGNEDATSWIVFNGEIYNYVELRPQLEARGHRFSTNSDTEVILHLYEDLGPACLEHLNGQFAIAIWDTKERSLFLARDRLGIRPLFYTTVNGQLVFGSEIKALLSHPDVSTGIDPTSLAQVFTYWSTLGSRTAFRGIHQIPPGHCLLAHKGQLTVGPYWELGFAPDADTSRTNEDYLDEFESLLIDASRIRLRADVPVGAYLSGGLDSSVTSAIVRRYSENRLDTFSIAFEDREFDESAYQQQMTAALGTNHKAVNCRDADIGRIFSDVVWHTETPILRTAPAPLFLLSELVHEQGLKVVLTGEGADEILAGYNIFKEMKVRRFWARNPNSQIRPLLLNRLYPYITDLTSGRGAYLTAFFKRGLVDTDSPFYSHTIRWENTARIQRFLAHKQETAETPGSGDLELPSLPPSFHRWSPLAQAQYLEITTFLSSYLLCSQGDRMAMAHSVEGRFPFLDHRVVEFCNDLPPGLKLRGLQEKWLLKQLGRKLVPTDIWQRPKQAYRAPIHGSFFHEGAPEYVDCLLSEAALRESGLFDPAAVGRLAAKARRGPRLSELDGMALVGILSAQILDHRFIKAFEPSRLRSDDWINVVDAVSSTDLDAKGSWGSADPTSTPQPCAERIPVALC